VRSYIAAATLLAALAVGVPLAAADPPSAPVFSPSTPPSPTNGHTTNATAPTLNGTAPAGTTVSIYAGSCPGTALATGPASNGTFQIAVSVKADTSTTFFATATSGNDVSACSEPFTYTEDETPPNVSLTRPPPVTGPDVALVFSATDSGSGIASVECRFDTEQFAACASPQNRTLPAGPHGFDVRATDAAGNSAEQSATWTVNTVAPHVTFTATPPVLTNRTTATFGFRADRDGSTFDCSLDGAKFAACSPPRVLTGLGNGSHTLSVRATWMLLTGPPSQYSWTVDTVPPQTTIASGPPSASTSATATFAFSSSEPRSTFVCSLDTSGFAPCTSPRAYSGLGDGSHTFRVQAVDPAGNADGSAAIYTWQIAGVGAPLVDLRPPANVTRLRRNVGYGRLQLHWRKPAAPDFDHVGVYVSTRAKSPPRKLVYSGRSQTYTDRRFNNGQYYRYLVVSYDHSKNASGGVGKTVSSSALLQSPRNDALVRSAPTFRWAAVRRASFYNIQLYRRGAKVLSAWPTRARQRLTRRWKFAGHSLSLSRGTYVWYVWPAFGPRAKSRYGQLLGVGSFRVR
jgi:hypothetical protein